MVVRGAIDQVLLSLDDNESFILDAGAGSGKTWTLVEALRHLIITRGKKLEASNSEILCVTFTRVARDEIIERTERSKMIRVSTIHDFLWSAISQFKVELKEVLHEVLSEKLVAVTETMESKKNKKTKTYADLERKKERYTIAILNSKESDKEVSYKNYQSYKNCIISHDDILDFTLRMFNKHESLAGIISKQYPYIFVDEYQDTSSKVMEIFLNHLLPFSPNITLGFFGDYFQKIYESGYGMIDDSYKLKRIEKKENFRCPNAVIKLLNKIRPELEQYPGKEDQIEGKAIFFNMSDNSLDESQILEKLSIDKTDEVKVLYLTHNKISKQNGYENLLSLYTKAKRQDLLIRHDENNGKDKVLDFLFEIEKLLISYEQGNIQDVLDETSYKINNVKDIVELKSRLDKVSSERIARTIESQVKVVIDNNLLKESDGFDLAGDELDEEDKVFRNSLLSLDYREFYSLFKTVSNMTPFSTKHSTKGDEFETVIVKIDDTAWNKYNFNDYFSGTNDEKRQNIIERTKYLFYVVCSRPTKNLVVCYENELSDESIKEIQRLFGSDSYIEL